MSLLHDYAAALDDATARLLTTAASFSDDDVRAPSNLEGWTRGHVLTHIARNADSLVRVLTGVRTGVPTAQYATPTQRAEGIEAGYSRQAKEQLTDLEESAARFAELVADMPMESWSSILDVDRDGGYPAWYVVMRRLREVEIHHTDLSAAYTWRDWPARYCQWEFAASLDDARRDQDFGGRIVATDGEVHDLGEGPTVTGPTRALVAWLTGRSGGEGLTCDAGPVPAPPKWMTLSAPVGLPATIPA